VHGVTPKSTVILRLNRMMSIELIKENIDLISQEVVEVLISRFGKNRLITIVLYGSAIAKSNIVPNDLDILVLLNTYSTEDVLILRDIVNNYPVELFIDYKDQIERKGLENYQRGRHGTYFFVSMAYAKVLYGKNYYTSHVGDIPFTIIQKDLLFRIEEYFYRIQKLISQKENIDLLMIEKYISRICTDLLLYTKELEFSKLHSYHYKEIVQEIFIKSNLVNNETTSLIEDLFGKQKVEIVPVLFGALYTIYMNCFDNWKKKAII
jgi:predicted nucleotidyltransferase